MAPTTTTTKTSRRPFELLFFNSGVEYFPKWKRIHRSMDSAMVEIASVNVGLEGAGFPPHNAIIYGAGFETGKLVEAQEEGEV